MIRIRSVAAIAALTVWSAPSWAAKWVYTVQNAQVALLPDPFTVGAESEARDINIHGQIVGWAYTSGQPNAWLYEPSGVYKNVGIPLTTVYALANGVNNLGEVVGIWLDNNQRRSFYWHPSTGFAPLSIKLQPGASYNDQYHFQANAINDFGRIVGSAEASPTATDIPFDPCFYDVPIYWIRPDTNPQVLYCPGVPGGENEAMDVNSYGWTAGFETGASERGFRHHGSANYVPWASGGNQDGMRIHAMNEKAAVAGNTTFTSPGVGLRAIYWDGLSRASISLGVLPGGKYSHADDVNDEDFVVGHSDRTLSTEAGIFQVVSAFLWRPEFGLRELPSPPPGKGQPYTSCGALGMTNFLPANTTQGTIKVVGFCQPNGKRRAVRWDVAVSRIWVP
jgi:uncharacterized membrane protein